RGRRRKANKVTALDDMPMMVSLARRVIGSEIDMDRRTFLSGVMGASAVKAGMTGPIPMGLNTYCLRSLRWNDAQLLDYCASHRASLPPGTIEQHVETAVKMLRMVRTQAMDSGVKVAIEVHKDLQAREHRKVVEGAGPEFVGTYLDTGNPVFVMEDPMQTVETLGPLALILHLRDSVVYETPKGIAVQWVPLGEGGVDCKATGAKATELCPPLAGFIQPLT